MTASASTRDYRLTGPSAREAVARGLASAQWYQTPVPRKTLKALMQRQDRSAIRDTLLWWALLLLFATLGVLAWGSWLAVPCFLVYGVLYSSASDSRWHECSHGTAFRTPWMNDLVYRQASFMILREPTVWRWSHARHHTDTIIVGLDPEINAPRPTPVLRHLLGLLAIPAVLGTLQSLLRHSGGRLTEDERAFIPEMEWPKVFQQARMYLALQMAVLLLAVGLQSWLPVMLVGVLPTMYGAWLAYLFGLTQHAGLADNVLDHRKNSRTIRMNPVFRFIYWNMNYHTEHHMYPMVPYHALPALHEQIKHDLPPVYPGTWAALCELVPALWRQRRDPDYFVDRPLPAAAEPPADADLRPAHSL